MADVDRWRSSYDDWKTTDPAEFDEPDDPCEGCDGTGEVMVCADPICRADGNCVHGDGGKACPACECRG